MKINGNAIRPGNIILHQGVSWRAVKCQTVKPGKGGAFNQVELRNLENGSKLNERFRSSEVVEKLNISTKVYQFLYSSGEILTFMDIENYDQIEITENLIGDQKYFLQNGMQVNLEIVEDKPVGISLPEQVVQEVIETEAVVKGQTASSSYKPAILKNGLRVMVPPHIEVGVKIIVSTLDCTYTGKHKL